MTDDGQSETDTVPHGDDGLPESLSEDISVSELHRLLANARRRIILSYLCTVTVAQVDELVDAVATEQRPEPGPATHRTRLRIDLHHVQLPTLADSGLVEYDPVAGTVRYDGPDTLEPFLDAPGSPEGTDG